MAKRLLRLLILLQVGLFFVGLMVPVKLAADLWGKSRQERLKVVWEPGGALSRAADQFPTNASIFWAYPDSALYQQLQYYFYPRWVSVTMTNQFYSEHMFAAWNESPDPDWLASHGFTHVIRIKTKDPVVMSWWSVNAKPN
jgi:hypothetical protein